MKERVIRHLLSNLDIHPVLVDIGASGGPPEIWGIIAQHSAYVGLDPDPREMYKGCETRFHKAVIVAEAITNDEESDEVPFYFTKSPYCSSTLAPNAQALSNFLFSDLFQVERTATVRATSLDKIMDRLSLPRIDWLKIDSQGTDLRIFNSLRTKVRNRVLAVDIELGLIGTYIGEDLFVDAHRQLGQEGFWLSNLNVCGTVRMRRSTLSQIMAFGQDISYDFVDRTVKKTPGWCEARYLRTIEWLAQMKFTRRDYVLLWTFALLDNQPGFALDLAMEYERVFGSDETSHAMQDEPILLMKQSHQAIQSVAQNDAITTGQGWYPVEYYRGQTFRWVANDAELIIHTPSGTRQTLSLELEPGPGLGSHPFTMQVLDERGQVVATTEVKGRAVVKVTLPISQGQTTVFRLHIEGGSLPTPSDPRILNFRIFRFGWSDCEPRDERALEAEKLTIQSRADDTSDWLLKPQIQRTIELECELEQKEKVIRGLHTEAELRREKLEEMAVDRDSREARYQQVAAEAELRREKLEELDRALTQAREEWARERQELSEKLRALQSEYEAVLKSPLQFFRKAWRHRAKKRRHAKE